MTPAPARAQTVWNGATSTDWFTGSNWSTGSVPTSGPVVIGNNSPNSAIILGTVTVSDVVTIRDTGQLTVSAPAWYNIGLVVGASGIGATVSPRGACLV